MLEQAALATSAPTPVQMPGHQETDFMCEYCDKSFKSLRGLKTHMGHIHRDIQKPEKVRNEDVNTSLEISHASDEREEIPHPLANSTTVSIPETKSPEKLSDSDETLDDRLEHI